MLIVPKNIMGVDVFLERFQTRLFVGELKEAKGHFHFYYDSFYLKMKNILSLGPEFPLTQQEFVSKDLFPSFLDRLPDPENPAYIDYCTIAKIPVTVTDPLVLLATVGKRGPSSFIFEPVYKNDFKFEEVEHFIARFGLSLQDFAFLFNVSLSILQKIKAGQTSGKEVLRRLEICLFIPEALDYQLQKNRKWVHPKKLETLDKFLTEIQMKKISKENYWKFLTDGEVHYTQGCLKELQSCPWAHPLIKKVNDNGLTQKSMPYLFEVRFAHELYADGLDIEPEYKTGVGETDVDFLIKEEKGTKWLVELTSLDESNEVKENTQVWENRFSFHSIITSGDEKNSPEILEIIKAQRAILSKVARKNKKTNTIEPTKFPLPKPNEYNIIIIDMRGFLIGRPNLNDYINILYGCNAFKHEEDRERYKRFFIDPKTNEKKPIIGIFDSSHPDEGSKYLQERVHGVGFVCEKTYQPDGIRNRLKLFPNPNFFETEEDLRNLWPLRITEPIKTDDG